MRNLQNEEIITQVDLTDSQTMSTYVELPGARPEPHVGTFEPSTELLERFRNILASSPPTSREDFPPKKQITHLPFQPEQRRETRKHESKDNRSASEVRPRSARGEVLIIKSARTYHRERHPQLPSHPDLPYLIHANIVDPLDILQDERGGYAVTFTSMTALSTLISQSRRLKGDEADSYFKQIIRGVEYLHHCSVAHQDLRPENLVVTMNGVVKIANFDNADYFGSSRRRHQKRRSMKRWSSSEYVAPEVFVEASFDPRPVDMWAVAVIYLEMRTGRPPWSLAAEGADESYDRYLQERSGLWGFRPIQNLSDENCRRVISSLLDPLPNYRYTASRVLKSTWCRSIELGNSVKNEDLGSVRA